jgi:hypothetical protein
MTTSIKNFSRSFLLAAGLVTMVGCGAADASEDGTTGTSDVTTKAGQLPPSPGDDGSGATTPGTPGTSPTTPTNPGGIWKPAPKTSWQWQLSGTIDTSFDVQMYDIDLFDTSVSTINAIKAKGAKVVCYFSAGSYEDWRSDASAFPAAALGSNMDGWPGEKWLDVRSAPLRAVMADRLDLAVQKGCDAVEPDNVDGYANDTGFPLTGADQLAYNKWLAAEAHARNLSIALKNDLDQIPELVSHFDFAVVEECFKYNECAMAKPFITANKAVFEVEYGNASLATTVCPKAKNLDFDTLIKNLDLDPTRTSCR